MNCSKCGKEYDDSFKFCPVCGEAGQQEAKPPVTTMEQPVPASGLTQPPLPSDDPQPPAQKTKSRGKRIAIALISVGIVLILGLCIVLGTVLIKGYEAKAKTEANQFIQNALKKDYEAQYKQISPSSYNIMWLSGVCSAENAGEPRTGPIPSDGISIQQAYAGNTGVLSGMFGGEPAKSSIQDGKLSSAKVTSISNQTFYIELNYKGATKPFPLIVNRQNNTYSVDFAATLVLNDPTIAKKTRQTVESLLQNPTVKNCDTAQAILVEAQTLKSELGLWLKNGPKNILSDTKATEINDAIKETEGFGELSARVEKAKESLTGKKPEPKPTATKESTPATTTPSTPQSTPSSKPKTTTKSSPQTTTTKSPEYMCASIQKGYEVAANDPLVSSFAAIFDALQSEYPSDTRESFADVVVTAKQQLDSNTTVNQTLLEVAQGIYGSTTPEIAKSVSLQEIAAAYVTILISEYGK